MKILKKISKYYMGGKTPSYQNGGQADLPPGVSGYTPSGNPIYTNDKAGRDAQYRDMFDSNRGRKTPSSQVNRGDGFSDQYNETMDYKDKNRTVGENITISKLPKYTRGPQDGFGRVVIGPDMIERMKGQIISSQRGDKNAISDEVAEEYKRYLRGLQSGQPGIIDYKMDVPENYEKYEYEDPETGEIKEGKRISNAMQGYSYKGIPGAGTFDTTSESFKPSTMESLLSLSEKINKPKKYKDLDEDAIEAEDKKSFNRMISKDARKAGDEFIGEDDGKLKYIPEDEEEEEVIEPMSFKKKTDKKITLKPKEVTSVSPKDDASISKKEKEGTATVDLDEMKKLNEPEGVAFVDMDEMNRLNKMTPSSQKEDKPVRMKDLKLFSPERKAEYDKRNWAYDDTIKAKDGMFVKYKMGGEVDEPKKTFTGPIYEDRDAANKAHKDFNWGLKNKHQFNYYVTDADGNKKIEYFIGHQGSPNLNKKTPSSQKKYSKGGEVADKAEDAKDKVKNAFSLSGQNKPFTGPSLDPNANKGITENMNNIFNPQQAIDPKFASVDMDPDKDGLPIGIDATPFGEEDNPAVSPRLEEETTPQTQMSDDELDDKAYGPEKKPQTQKDKEEDTTAEKEKKQKKKKKGRKPMVAGAPKKGSGKKEDWKSSGRLGMHSVIKAPKGKNGMFLKKKSGKKARMGMFLKKRA
tara:strand:+ start:518 stop:2590 length:2073 start_codon:yes stop_codon:yes gene_type:complete